MYYDIKQAGDQSEYNLLSLKLSSYKFLLLENKLRNKYSPPREELVTRIHADLITFRKKNYKQKKNSLIFKYIIQSETNKKICQRFL